MLAKYAQINDSIIVNIFIADEELVGANYPNAIQCPDFVGVGDSFIDGVFISNAKVMEANELEAQ